MKRGKAIVVIDLETTGTDPERHCIIDIAAKVLFAKDADELNSGKKFARQCHFPTRTEAFVDIAASAVNGRWPNQIDNTQCYDENSVLVSLCDFLGLGNTITIAGINPNFDRGFILKRGLKHGLELDSMFSHRTFDLHSLAMFHALHTGEDWTSLTSSGIYRLFGEEPEEIPHTSEGGTDKEWALFDHLCRYGLEGRKP